MSKRVFLISVLCCCGIAPSSHAQTFYASQNFNIRNTYGYEIVSGLPDDEIVVFQDKLFHYEMFGLDSALQTLWKKRVQLDIGVSHVLSVFRIDTAICLILGYHQGRHSVIEALLYNRRGEPISRRQLYLFTTHYDISQMKWTESYNHKWGLIFFKRDDKTMRCLRVYLPTLHSYSPVDIVFDTRQWRQQFQSAKITDDGFFAFAFIQTEGWLVKDERTLLLIYGDTTGTVERYRWTMEDHFITDAFLERGMGPGTIHCVGVYTSPRHQAEGYWSVTLRCVKSSYRAANAKSAAPSTSPISSIAPTGDLSSSAKCDAKICGAPISCDTSTCPRANTSGGPIITTTTLSPCRFIRIRPYTGPKSSTNANSPKTTTPSTLLISSCTIRLCCASSTTTTSSASRSCRNTSSAAKACSTDARSFASNDANGGCDGAMPSRLRPTK